MQDPQQQQSAELLASYRAGDERAADELFHRYVVRLTILARSRLSSRVAGRTDPEDIVMSAYRSFFIGARAGRFSLHRSGDLWPLLVSITMHKLYRQVRRHTAECRSVDVEQSLPVAGPDSLPIGAHDPTPEEVIGLSDELETILVRLNEFQRRVLELRLQGDSIAEIAATTDRAERFVRRALHSIRELLAARLRNASDG